MKRICLILLLFMIQRALFAQQAPSENGIDSFIRRFLESNSPEEKPKIGENELFSTVVIHRFYGERNFEPAWVKDHKLPEIAYEMRYEIGQAKFDGLNPDDYHFQAINAYFDRFESAKKAGEKMNTIDLAAVDVLLTDAYIMLSSHLFLGKVDPESLKTTWSIQRNVPELMIDRKLSAAIQSGSLRASIEGYYPAFSIYKKMRDGLRQLFEEQKRFEKEPVAIWKNLKIDKSIKPGDTHNQMPEIRERLYFWGFLKPYQPVDDKMYDSLMIEGIKTIQRRFGMEPDGVIGQGTIHAFNQKPLDMIATASVNLERLRWFPDTIKDIELILVNTANFQLDFIQKLDTVLTSRVIVGKSYHSTPQFSALMSYIVFSPTWTVPTSITRNEIVPKIKKDPNYLAKNNMVLLNSSGSRVDPSSIDWGKVSARSFPYTVRQEPGDHNSLGLVKFMFPNKNSVYIHDTPSRTLFAREDRALSHGCIRIQKPFEFAKILLSNQPSWTDEKITSAMHQSKEVTVNLDRKIPVALIYLTHWADSRGNLYFRNDIYDRDGEIYQALKETRIKKSGI
ncbi:L,D-transpeptidase family protein [Aquiflexum gelatinilyticum]|uniref:L,D-transpeptidase family protein n=1 Tax=Aquiflexum gelatinilyticum TaxID=2961943 RepID=UPI002166FCE2|nr:L,D-transpeptidase family protein [Aquiflexum gelatinilyticum]MCS4436151.1 L,D-transpeptidase family protein [Aquiflexum gelatinilyticum]